MGRIGQNVTLFDGVWAGVHIEELNLIECYKALPSFKRGFMGCCELDMWKVLMSQRRPGLEIQVALWSVAEVASQVFRIVRCHLVLCPHPHIDSEVCFTQPSVELNARQELTGSAYFSSNGVNDEALWRSSLTTDTALGTSS